MFAGMIGSLFQLGAGVKGVFKSFINQSPMQNLDWLIWFKQNFLGGGGAIASAREAGASPSIMDPMSRQSPQQARQPPPQQR